MWCRTILTAVAISYVVCMLLWSGLQKEDLDVKTLEKLARYNVNIDDMNNAQQRQECMSRHVTTEVHRDTFGTFANTTGIEHYDNEMYPKMEMILSKNIENKAFVHHEVNNNKSKGDFDPTTEISTNMPDLENATKVEEDKAANKFEFDIQNQHDIESVINVWSKLTRYNTTAVTIMPTAAALVTTTEQRETHKDVMSTLQVETHNNEYVKSPDIEYIKRMLEKFSRNQTVTVTERVLKRKKIPNVVPMKYWNLFNKASVEEKPNRRNKPKFAINNINNITQDNLRLTEALYNNMLDETKSMPYRVNRVTYDSANEINKIQITPYSQLPTNEPKARRSIPVKKDNPLGILLNILQMKHELFNNGVLISETESTPETFKLFPTKRTEQQVKKSSFNLFHQFPYLNFVNKNISKNFMMNNDESTTATIEPKTWESVLIRNGKINKEFEALPISRRQMSQMQNLYNQFKATPSNIIKTRQITTYYDETNITAEPEQVQKLNIINNGIVTRQDTNKSKLYHNSYMDYKRPWFQAMLPIINYRNKDVTNNQVLEMIKGFNKLHPNKNFEMVTDQSDTVMIPKWDPTFPSIQPIYDTTQIKTTNNFDGHNQQLAPIYVNDLKANQHVNSMNMPEIQAIQTNMIKDIAEKVKRMIMKQIEISTSTTVTTTSSTTTSTTTTAATTTSTTTTSTTQAPTTVTVLEKPSKPIEQVFTQTNEVIQKLMEMFQELKAAKDTVELTSQVPEIPTAINYGTIQPPPLPIQPNPEVPASSKSYLMHNPLIPNSLAQNPLIPNPLIQNSLAQNPLVPNPLIQNPLIQNPLIQNPLIQIPLMQNPLIQNPLLPNPLIPNSQVAPSSKSYLIQNPPVSMPIQSKRVVQLSSGFKPQQNEAPPYMSQLNVHQNGNPSWEKDYRLRQFTMQTNSDEIAPLAIHLAKPLKLINQNIVVTTKQTDEQLKEEQKQNNIKNIEEKLRLPTEARNHKEKLQHQGNFSKKQSRFAVDIKKHESRDHNFYKSKYMNREKSWHSHEYNEKVHNMEKKHHEMLQFSELHNQGRLSHLEHSNRPRDLKIFEDLNHGRGIGKPVLNEHKNQQTGVSHRHHQSRYDKPTKFHEKLENIENGPQSSWKDIPVVLPSDSNYDEISGRQQMTMTKVKHRTKYNDSRFTNFLKSQQKVTDMLEKILANNAKNSDPNSVETL